jgi:hypothetical protein
MNSLANADGEAERSSRGEAAEQSAAADHRWRPQKTPSSRPRCAA